MFIGLFLVAGIITAGVITFRQNDKENVTFLKNPKPGDIYDIKLGYQDYTLYKVDRVEGNMVYLFENTYTVNRATGMDDLKTKPFTSESFPVQK